MGDEVLNRLFDDSIRPEDDETADLETPILHIDLDEVDSKTRDRARVITEHLADYFLDVKYINDHPYIKNKISQEVDNIRRLLKMLYINEKAQDVLINSITMSAGKGTLYGNLTALQNSTMQLQAQLNSLTEKLEAIFEQMQANCEQTFEQKDKETSDDGSKVVRGSRDFIKEINKMLGFDTAEENNTDNADVEDENYDMTEKAAAV